MKIKSKAHSHRSCYFFASASVSSGSPSLGLAPTLPPSLTLDHRRELQNLISHSSLFAPEICIFLDPHLL